jgi:hypothetical protein
MTRNKEKTHMATSAERQALSMARYRADRETARSLGPRVDQLERLVTELTARLISELAARAPAPAPPKRRAAKGA